MTTQITVEYPTMEHRVKVSAEEMQARGYKNHKGIVQHLPVNRPQVITVKQVKRLVQEEFMTTEDYEAELEAMCLQQTGMTRAAYQSRYKQAWNE